VLGGGERDHKPCIAPDTKKIIAEIPHTAEGGEGVEVLQILLADLDKI
jgi:hypothetical protein